jgi:hypothetical protein
MTRILDTQTRGHHPHSPSSLQSSEACAHFENEQRESEAARLGTLQHKAAETRDLSILDDPAHIAAVNRAIKLEDAFIERLTITDEVVVASPEAGEQLTIQRVPPQVVREKYLPVDASHIEHEHLVHDEYRAWAGVTGGYPDTVLIQPLTKQAVVADWKFGKEYVTPTCDNMQGKAYAAGVLEAFPEVDEVTVVFYHPHLEVDEFGEILSKDYYTHTFTRDERKFIELQIRTFVARKKLAKAQGLNNSEIPQVPKTSLCLWCANKAKCRPLGALMVLGASKHKEIVVPELLNPTELSTPPQYAAAYRFANEFEALAKAVKRRVTDAATKDGINLSGEGLEVARRRDPSVENPAEIKRIALENFGVTETEFDACINIPITKIDAAIKAKAPKGKGAPTVRAFRDEAQKAGALVMGEGYLFLREMKKEKSEAAAEKDLDI